MAKPEAVPLLPVSIMQDKGHGSTQPHVSISIKEDTAYWEDEESREEDKVLFSDNKQRGTSLILNDAILITLEFLQLFGLIQSLALRWPWPEDWLKVGCVDFLVNLDIWEFIKLQTNGTFKAVQDYYTPSTDVPIDFWHILLAWGCFVFILIVTFIIAYIVLTYQKHPFMMVKLAKMQRVYIIVLQVIAVPLGVVMGRVFHLTDTFQVDIDNQLQGYMGLHWAFLAPIIAFSIVYYIIFPAWLIQKTKKEILTSNRDQHEGYLQLKETEYVQGLDVIWMVGGYHIFSSFKLWGIYYRPVLHILKFVIIIVYAALYNYTFWQSVCITVILFVMVVAFIIVRPFRVTSFNVMLVINYNLLMLCALLGSMQSTFDSLTIQSPWFTPDYIFWILIIMAVVWLFAVFVFLLNLFLKQAGKCGSEPLWPSMTTHGLDKLSPETRKYVRAILNARHVLEKCLNMPPIFAPAHELSRQIQIINAFSREAELLHDPIHDTMWDLLDELIDAHSTIAPKSLFADSVKSSIRQTASELMKLMPMFVRRLAQREYDFILVSPLKRRMLLKMYCLGMFLNNRSFRIRKDKMASENIKKMWKEQSDHDRSASVELQLDDGYYEDMYPEQEHRPGQEYRPETVMTFSAEQDDEQYIDELDEWMKAHPTSQQAGEDEHGYDNLSFADDESMDLSDLMKGVPSLPNSRPNSSLSVRQARPGSRPGSRSTPRPGSAANRPPSRPASAAGAAVYPPRPASVTGSQSGSNSGSRPASAAGSRPGSATRPGSAAGSRPGSATGRSQTPSGQQSEHSGTVHTRPMSRPGSAVTELPGGNEDYHLEPLIEVPTPRGDTVGVPEPAQIEQTRLAPGTPDTVVEMPAESSPHQNKQLKGQEMTTEL